MRGTRGVLLVAIVAILAAVAGTYYYRNKNLAKQAPAPPKSLPVEVDAAASDWVWSSYRGKDPVVEVRAKSFRQVKDRFELERVELRLHHRGAQKFDLVKSAKCKFDVGQGTLYSEGEVEITMGLPAEATPRGRLVLIRSSGVSFESKSGRASTERAASFTFDLGEGKAVGASYDPGTRELHMKSQIELLWRGRGPKSKPMELEAGELIYKEREAVVLLFPWSRLRRENTVLEAGDALVALQDGSIQRVEAKQARGSDRYPARQLEYAAEQLTMNVTPEGEIEKIVAERNAKLVSTSEAARTTITTDRVELDFEVVSGESELKKALAMGSSSMESVPLPRKGVPLAETRLLKSETILLSMRAGGKEIQSVETQAPGRLEFLPNRPGQRRRRMDGERMWITYGANNQIQSFRAIGVYTRSEPPQPQKKKEPGPVLQTWSKDLAAEFEPKTSQLARLEQWGDFRYEEGERKGRAEHAVLEETRERITLERGARVWDASGTTSAERMALDQKSGDITAQGKVVSTRMPDRKGTSSAMLSQEEPLDGTAERMSTSNRNQKISYEGEAVVWQGANRIRAERIDIDRQARRLAARGNVRTQFVDAPKPGSPAAKKKAAPTFVTVESAELVYTEENRLAHYTGGARLSKEGMEVKAAEIRAYLNEAKADSSLDRAYADGQVEIIQRQAERIRKGTAEHAEYYVAEAKINLHGGDPTLVDSLRGSTRGAQLTYYPNDDKLLVNGAEQQPVKTRIRRRS
jgi:lipopolysaccharide export system protein LptA